MAILALLAAAGCGGSKPGIKAPPTTQAQGFADDFVRRLVIGRWNAIAGDVTPLLTRQLQKFQQSIRRDGIRKVRGPGVLRHDCPVSPTGDGGSDCFVYRLVGRQVVPIQGAIPLKARYRLWVGYEDGRWQVESYDYDLIPAG